MINRTFLPGDNWVYYKVYVDETLSDFVLTKRISKIAMSAARRKIIDSWFFIRYNDPDSHIRVRFHLTDSTNLHKLVHIFNLFSSPLVRSGAIKNISINMYERELERYGFSKIVAFEDLFSIDSQNIILFLKTKPTETEKIIEAICKSYYFIDKFLTGYNNKLEFVKSMGIAFMNEHFMDKALNLNKKYRNLKPQLFRVLQKRQLAFDDEYNSVIHKLHMTQFQQSFLSSIIHMSINRLFNANQRKYELIVYLYLEKLLLNLKQMNHSDV